MFVLRLYISVYMRDKDREMTIYANKIERTSGNAFLTNK